MRKLISGAVAAATLAGTAFTGTAASAQRWGYHGGWGHRGYGTGAVVGAGLLGLAAGVALTSRPYYGGGYYRPYGYYGGGYGYGYAPAYYGGYGYGGCGTVWRWDPYVGHRVPVRRCW